MEGIMGRLFVVLSVLLLLHGITVNGGDDGNCTYSLSFSQRPHSVSLLEFGAVGDGVTMNTVAFQNAVFYLRSFADKGGAQLYIPKGKWLTGSFNLTSHLTLFLDRGAIILGSQDISQWPLVDPLPSYGRGREHLGGRYRSLINGNNLTDVVITGENGTIDGQGHIWWESYLSHSLNYSRPHILEIVSSTDILISNLTLLNPPAFSIHPVYSSNVQIQNIVIHSSPDSPFTSGIVPDSCWDTCIEGGSISVGHDGIALKSGWDQYGISFGKPSSAIHITQVSIQASDGSALAFGSEMSGGISDIHVDNLHIHNSLTAIKFKTTEGRGGFMENIVISDTVMENVNTAIHFTGHCGDHPDDKYDPTALPKISRITLKNIVGHNVSVAGVLTGISGDPFTDICLSNIALAITADPSRSWTCSNVSGFSESVVPQPCPDLIQITYANISYQCFSLVVGHQFGGSALPE
ncbi:probable polygalacturonase isoform X2 [Dioscorea cayenensis subsp. rotundata]|uniref:Probable polygalacturonase isoform X2 n=1 Tax=Dioscorea cayennensis subsp. rotundata TaxID=55577 RepID=A0AB40BJY0_DIOCR|nr:probable polygalacturonase isoform X2 [Dioscorea cayenensis subsp. rotundata]